MVFYDNSRGHSRHKEFILKGQVEILRAESGGCPICGHPTGDCAGEHEFAGTNWVPYAPRKQGPDMHYVEERVYTEREISGRKTRVLAAAAGTWITKDEARNLGLI